MKYTIPNISIKLFNNLEYNKYFTFAIHFLDLLNNQMYINTFTTGINNNTNHQPLESINKHNKYKL